MLSYNVACIINAKQFGKRHHVCILANNRCYDPIFILQLISLEINKLKIKFDFTLLFAKKVASTLALSKPDIGPQSNPKARAAIIK